MPIITEIIKQKNSKTVDLILDHEFFCTLSADAFSGINLKEGQEVDKDSLKEMIKKQEQSAAMDRALKYLGYKICSSFKMQQYLQGKGYDEEIAKRVVLRLEELRLLDDKVFSESYVKSCRGKYGNALLSYKLKNFGISSQIISEVLPDSELESVMVLAQKYLKTKKANRQKLFSYLYNKGFSSESIQTALTKLESEFD